MRNMCTIKQLGIALILFLLSGNKGFARQTFSDYVEISGADNPAFFLSQDGSDPNHPAHHWIMNANENALLLYDQDSSGNLTFPFWINAYSQSGIMIDNSNVGIGYATPTQKLPVYEYKSANTFMAATPAPGTASAATTSTVPAPTPEDTRTKRAREFATTAGYDSSEVRMIGIGSSNVAFTGMKLPYETPAGNQEETAGTAYIIRKNDSMGNKIEAWVGVGYPVNQGQPQWSGHSVSVFVSKTDAYGKQTSVQLAVFNGPDGTPKRNIAVVNAARVDGKDEKSNPLTEEQRRLFHEAGKISQAARDAGILIYAIDPKSLVTQSLAPVTETPRPAVKPMPLA